MACGRHTSLFLGTQASGRGLERSEHGPGLAWAQECSLPRGRWVRPGKGQGWSFTVCTRVVGGQGPHHPCYYKPDKRATSQHHQHSRVEATQQGPQQIRLL